MVEYVPRYSFDAFLFDLPHDLDLIHCRYLVHGVIDPSLVDSIMVTNILEGIKVGNTPTQVTCIIS